MVASPVWNRPDEPFAELLSAEVIGARVAELGAQITADYAPLSRSADVVVIGVLKGSVIFPVSYTHLTLPTIYSV